MSSDSSEIDVIRTRITDYSDEDGPALYAYQSKPCPLFNVEDVLPETPCQERPQTVGDVLTHCRIIRDSIQTLDKKFNVIRGKVLKLHRLQVKSVWQSHRAFGFFSYKTLSYPLSLRLKYQRARKKHDRCGFPARAGGRRALLVMQPRAEGTNNEASPAEASAPTQGALMEAQQEKPRGPQDPPTLSSRAARSLPPCSISEERKKGEGPSSQPSGSRHPAARLPAAFPETVLPVGEQPLTGHPEPTASTTPLGLKRRSQSTCSSLYRLLAKAGSSARARRSPSDPATWSVDEVSLFLKQNFAESLGPLADLFREHDIDGEALLLLTSDAMVKYMDLKLGTALKVYGHIERLKEKKYPNN